MTLDGAVAASKVGDIGFVRPISVGLFRCESSFWPRHAGFCWLWLALQRGYHKAPIRFRRGGGNWKSLKRPCGKV
jgi:hypothetical protein